MSSFLHFDSLFCFLWTYTSLFQSLYTLVQMNEKQQTNNVGIKLSRQSKATSRDPVIRLHLCTKADGLSHCSLYLNRASCYRIIASKLITQTIVSMSNPNQTKCPKPVALYQAWVNLIKKIHNPNLLPNVPRFEFAIFCQNHPIYFLFVITLENQDVWCFSHRILVL